jgi:hypothetical protein
VLPFISKVYSLSPEIINIHKILVRKPEGNKGSFERLNHEWKVNIACNLEEILVLTGSGQQAFRNMVKNP